MSDMSVQTSEPTQERSRSRRGVLFYVGVTLVLAGLGLLGYVGWQVYGTNIVARQTHQRVITDLQQTWRATGALPGAPAAAVEPGNASALLRVPRFGDDYEVPVLEGIGDEELSSGYGHFPNTAGPGETGNYALAAHRITHGEPLRDMPRLRPGDDVLVETHDAIYTYRLDTDPNDLVVTFEAGWVVDPVPVNPQEGGVQPLSQQPGQKLITLTTCAELFHTDNRMIVFGHLVGTEKKLPQ
jgi:sortase A